MSMFRMKSLCTVLVLAVIVCVGQMAFATDATVTVIAGSSALWQSAALGAYNGTTSGNCPANGVAPCSHWTSGSNKLTLVDSRPSTANNDTGTVWVVWDSATTSTNGIPNIWLFAKVDSVVGDRCFFAKPACRVTDTLNPTTCSDWSGTGANQITVVWGSDVALPTAVFNYLCAPANVSVNVAATDIRPEDAWWAMNRANSALGSSTYGGAQSDGTDGLGYNANNAAGISPNYVTATTGECTGLAQSKGVGTPVYSAYTTTSTSTDTANVLAFNILGKDPITCSSLATYDVANVGATPVVFIASRTSQLQGLYNATEQQLQQVFSGLNTDASAFGLAANSINAFLREPTSGTMNTTEATVFRFPTLYSTTSAAEVVEGHSQELCTGNPSVIGTSNPLHLASDGASCANGATGAGEGYRWRAIGTSELVKSVKGSPTGVSNSNAVDGIGYTFFSYGNVNSIADNTGYGYITLNGVDPIFLNYNGGLSPSIIDFGQPLQSTYGIPGILPGLDESVATTLPACENQIWKYGYSFPNVRNGSYRAWSILRFVYGTSLATDVGDLVKASNAYVVTSVPDYIPFAAVTPSPACPAAPTGGTTLTKDPGFLVVRSHYLQRDGNGLPLGKPSTACANVTSEYCGDMGGAILFVNTSAVGITDSVIQLVTSDTGHDIGPALRPAQ